MLPNWLYGKSLRKLQEILNSGGQTAAGVSYSNTESGLKATNAQAAIDEIVDNVEDYYFEVSETAYNYSVTVNTDGVKSYKTLLNELATELLAKAQALSSDEYIHVVSVQGYHGDWFLSLNTNFNYANSVTSLAMSFRGLTATGYNAHIKSMSIHTTLDSCVYHDWTITTSGNTVADMTNDVPASGGSISLRYTIKKRIF